MSEEKEYRKKAHTFIYDSCQLLKTKALVIAAAQTICQRYFSQVSFRKIDRNVSETPLFGYTPIPGGQVESRVALTTVCCCGTATTGGQQYAVRRLGGLVCVLMCTSISNSSLLLHKIPIGDMIHAVYIYLLYTRAMIYAQNQNTPDVISGRMSTIHPFLSYARGGWGGVFTQKRCMSQPFAVSHDGYVLQRVVYIVGSSVLGPNMPEHSGY